MSGSVSTADNQPQGADAALAVPVWDVPVRLVHWSLVLLIAFSWWSAENGRTQWHIWSGLSVLFLTLFRIFWGLVGSSTARFRTFVTGPRRLIAYLRRPDEWRAIGHTPLGALSVVALLGLITLQLLLGLPLSDEDGIVAGPLNRLVDFDTAETAHGLHEALFNVLLGFIVMHLLAIIYYRLRGKRLVRALITGRSEIAGASAGFVPAKPLPLLLSLLGSGAITYWLASGAPGL